MYAIWIYLVAQKKEIPHFNWTALTLQGRVPCWQRKYKIHHYGTAVTQCLQYFKQSLQTIHMVHLIWQIKKVRLHLSFWTSWPRQNNGPPLDQVLFWVGTHFSVLFKHTYKKYIYFTHSCMHTCSVDRRNYKVMDITSLNGDLCEKYILICPINDITPTHL